MSLAPTMDSKGQWKKTLMVRMSFVHMVHDDLLYIKLPGCDDEQKSCGWTHN